MQIRYDPIGAGRGIIGDFLRDGGGDKKLVPAVLPSYLFQASWLVSHIAQDHFT